uniref:Uncharacterized protein n=1 Tax=Anopheles atroparvus TaxID=41427 RepID=A0AAG5DPW0_ANOAO
MLYNRMVSLFAPLPVPITYAEPSGTAPDPPDVPWPEPLVVPSSGVASDSP